MQFEVKNNRGEIIGEVIDGVYHTQRDKLKSELFIKKQTFGDKFFQVPVAIDKDILERLIKAKVKKTRMLIINLEKRSFVVEFDNETFLREGAEINYDKRNSEGQNYTKFGVQVVWDLNKGTRIVPEKEKITRYM